MQNLTHFSLCSGIGGIDLAAEWIVVTQQVYPLFKAIAEYERAQKRIS